MRTPNSDCLLCKSNKATKGNSHIVSRFMSKNILGDGNTKRGYLTKTSSMHLPPKFEQDTPKESFILCPSCEKYFEILETYISQRLNNKLWDIRFASHFAIESQEGIHWKVCNNIEPIIFRLFIYSIIWRCSISYTSLFKDFKLENDYEEYLRVILFKSKYEQQVNLISAIEKLKKDFPIYEFIIFTSSSFVDRTQNLLLCIPWMQNPYYLILGEYVILFSFINTNGQTIFPMLNNSDSGKIKVGFITPELWENVMKQFLEVITKISLENLSKTGKTPWITKNIIDH